ncbi:MAG: Bbp16 family capsid cement protein [Beijerinckiaceae bacterium]
MYLDRQLTVSNSQNVTATAVSTDAIDTQLTPVIRDIGAGEDMRMIIATELAALSAGASTVTFEIIQADDVALTTNVEVLAATGAIPKATIVAGYMAMDIVLPRNTRRYIGVRYTVGTGPLTQGRFIASLCHDSDRQKFYPSGYPNAY